MIRIAVLGDIGSGKSYVSKLFGYPVFSADKEVVKIYNKNQNCFIRLKNKLPKFITSFPIKKHEINKAIIINKNNIKKISKIVHPYVRLEMNKFLKKNKKKKIVVLDIPLLLEGNLNRKKDILVFVESRKKLINIKLKKRKNFDKKVFNELKNLQLPLEFKKKKSNFIIKNNFNGETVKKNVKNILSKIL